MALWKAERQPVEFVRFLHDQFRLIDELLEPVPFLGRRAARSECRYGRLDGILCIEHLGWIDVEYVVGDGRGRRRHLPSDRDAACRPTRPEIHRPSRPAARPCDRRLLPPDRQESRGRLREDVLRGCSRTS